MPRHKENRIPTNIKPRISEAGAIGHLETKEATEAPSIRALVESQEAKNKAVGIDAWKIATR